MIDQIRLKFGSSAGRDKLSFEPSSITVFIGPNNSGKSKLIDEIAAQCLNGVIIPSDIILDEVIFSPYEDRQIDKILNSIEVPPPNSSSILHGYTYIRQRGGPVQMHRGHIIKGLSNPNDLMYRNNFAQAYLRPRTIVLNGRNRIELSNEQDGGDLQSESTSTLQHLFKNDDLRKKYRSIIYKSFGTYAVIDPTKLGKLRLRLSIEDSTSPELERGLGKASVEFHSKAQLIEDASDGAKAFSGVLAEVMAGDPEILLMDEPEAFLHPALAFNMGMEISRSIAATTKKLFVSTHSAHFLMGCIQSGVPLNVVRLTYQNGKATARLLPSNEIKRLMRNPLLRSTGVISALFYQSVVVTEADADRAFYQEINERLQRCGRGIPNCIFLNAQNKHTVPYILEPLRSLGIPSAAIYDLDFIKDGGGVSSRFMQTSGVPILQQNSLNQLRSDILRTLNNVNPSWKNQGGIDVLNDSEKDAAENYFDQLDSYGAFVVRKGELESWLQSFYSGGHGPNWLVSMFTAMGEDPDVPGYIVPDSGDVWEFIEKVAGWLLDSNRKGIPA